MTDAPAIGEAPATTLYVPAWLGSVQLARDVLPFASVVALLGAMMPPPSETAKFTPTAGTGFPAASRTMTCGRLLRAAPTVPVNDTGPSAVSSTGIPALSVIALEVAAVRPEAENASVTGPVPPTTARSVNVATPAALVTTLLVPLRVRPLAGDAT